MNFIKQLIIIKSVKHMFTLRNPSVGVTCFPLTRRCKKATTNENLQLSFKNC